MIEETTVDKAERLTRDAEKTELLSEASPSLAVGTIYSNFHLPLILPYPSYYPLPPLPLLTPNPTQPLLHPTFPLPIHNPLSPSLSHSPQLHP